MSIPKKQVAGTLKTILTHPDMQVILDKSSNIFPVIENVMGYWSYDLFSRKPGPAYRDGVFVGTDLDLAAFLFALADRGAVINLPTYKTMRQKKVKEGEVVVSSQNRHGQLLGLTANKETFVFSIKIKDMNVMSTDSVGAFRNFSLTDFDGSWYEGWEKIQFLPDASENKFLTENKLWSGNTVVFRNFVHPNRWTSFFGQYYFITKVLIDRLTEEAAHYYTQILKLKDMKIEYPPSELAKFDTRKSEAVGGAKSEKVNAFEVEIDVPMSGDFPLWKATQENLVELTRKRTQITYSIIPKLRFMARATELAYYLHEKKHGETTPAWIENAKWEKGWKAAGKRTAWDRLILFQPAPGQLGVSIRKRLYTKSERVSEDY